MIPVPGSDNEKILKELTKQFDAFTEHIDMDKEIYIYENKVQDFRTGNKKKVKVGEIGEWVEVKFIYPRPVEDK